MYYVVCVYIYISVYLMRSKVSCYLLCMTSLVEVPLMSIVQNAGKEGGEQNSKECLGSGPDPQLLGLIGAPWNIQWYSIVQYSISI